MGMDFTCRARAFGMQSICEASKMGATQPNGNEKTNCFLFASDNLHLTARNKKSLECAAAWLRQHQGDRVLDWGGSRSRYRFHRGRARREFEVRLGRKPEFEVEKSNIPRNRFARADNSYRIWKNGH